MARRGIATINDSALEAGLRKMGFVQEKQVPKCTADPAAAQRAVLSWIDHRFYNKTSEDTMKDINSLKFRDRNGKEDAGKSKRMRRELFEKLLGNNRRYEFCEETGTVRKSDF